MEHLEDDLGLPRKYRDNSTAKAAGRQGADSGTGINRRHSQPGADIAPPSSIGAIPARVSAQASGRCRLTSDDRCSARPWPTASMNTS